MRRALFAFAFGLSACGGPDLESPLFGDTTPTPQEAPSAVAGDRVAVAIPGSTMPPVQPKETFPAQASDAGASVPVPAPSSPSSALPVESDAGVPPSAPPAQTGAGGAPVTGSGGRSEVAGAGGAVHGAAGAGGAVATGAGGAPLTGSGGAGAGGTAGCTCGLVPPAHGHLVCAGSACSFDCDSGYVKAGLSCSAATAGCTAAAYGSPEYGACSKLVGSAYVCPGAMPPSPNCLQAGANVWCCP